MAKGIGDVVYNLLSNNAPVAAIVGNKIFAYMASDDIVYPYIVYSGINIDPIQTKDGVSCLDTTTVDIEIYSEDLSEIEDLGNKVRTALDRVNGTVETVVIQSISFTDGSDGYLDTDRVFYATQSYSFRILK